MFKTETHLHTKESSWCGWLSAEDMLKEYRKRGYSTVCISDHFKQEYFDAWGDISWEEKIKRTLLGYYNAKKVADKYGINVLMSTEIEFEDTKPNHYLLYGVTEEFLISNVDLCKMSIDKFAKIAKENSIFIIQAHPFRNGVCFPTPEYVDAFEIYNGNIRHKEFGDAGQLAKEKNLYVTSGSDAHRLEDVGTGGIITDSEIRTMEELIAVIKCGDFETIGIEKQIK